MVAHTEFTDPIEGSWITSFSIETDERTARFNSFCSAVKGSEPELILLVIGETRLSPGLQLDIKGSMIIFSVPRDLDMEQQIEWFQSGGSYRSGTKC